MHYTLFMVLEEFLFIQNEIPVTQGNGVSDSLFGLGVKEID